MTNDEILETAARNAAYILKLERENDQLKKVLKLTPNELLAGGFCLGIAHRKDAPLDEGQRAMLRRAGYCIMRIMNGKEAEP